MDRRILSWFLVLLSSVCLQAKDSSVDLNPLLRALDAGNLFASASGPFTVTADVVLHKIGTKGDEKGSFKINWQSPTNWRRDIKTATFQASEGVMQGTGWEMNNTGWAPLRIVQIDDLRQAYAAIRDMAEHGQASEKKSGQNTCWRLEKKDQLPLEVCVSKTSGTVETLIYKDTYYTFKNYKEALGKKLPGSIKVNSLAQDVAELSNIQAAPVVGGTMEAPPQGAWKAAALACLLGPRKVVHKVVPEYPAIARMNNEVGVVTVGAMVGPDGKVTATAVLQRASMALDSAALEAVKTWEFEPAQCNGQAVESRTDVSIQFNPQHTDLSKGSLPLYH